MTPQPQAPAPLAQNKPSPIVGCGGLFVVVCFGFAMCESQRRSQIQAQQANAALAAQQASASAARRRETPMRGVAFWKTTRGFQVCSREPLHNCSASYGFENTGMRATYNFPPIPLVRAFESCDSQLETARATCEPDAALGEDPTAETTACLRGYGVFRRCGTNCWTRADPRDEQQRPGRLYLQCDEGVSGADFDNPL